MENAQQPIMPRERKADVILVCENCKQSFSRRAADERVSKQATRFFCSRTCCGKANSSPVPSTLIAEYEAGASMMGLGKKYHITPKNIRLLLIAHRIEIRPKTLNFTTDGNPTKGKGHTEQTKAKLRAANERQFAKPAARQEAAQRTIKQIQEGKTGKAYNKLETCIAERLTAESVEFLQQHRVGFYVYDFYLPATNTLIEANGGYWHADPRFYSPDNLKPVQKVNVLRDKQKRTYAENMGYTVQVLWEYDVTGRKP